MTPLINGESYSWSQIIVNIFGTPIAGITEIEYADEQKMQNNYGAGNNPVSRGYGNIEPSASLTLEMNEVEALQNAVDSGRLQDIPEFEIIVSYLPQNGNIKTHTIRNCRFMKNVRAVKQDDMTIPVKLDLIVSDIAWK